VTDDFTKAKPVTSRSTGVTLEENALRQRSATDRTSPPRAAQFDCAHHRHLPRSVDLGEEGLAGAARLNAGPRLCTLTPAAAHEPRSALSADGKLYAAPFYGEAR